MTTLVSGSADGAFAEDVGMGSSWMVGWHCARIVAGEASGLGWLAFSMFIWCAVDCSSWGGGLFFWLLPAPMQGVGVVGGETLDSGVIEGARVGGYAGSASGFELDGGFCTMLR